MRVKYAFADVGHNSGYSWINFSRAFKLHLTGKSWPEAEAECSKEGGHLASVDSEEMNKELQTRSRYAGDLVTVGFGWEESQNQELGAGRTIPLGVTLIGKRGK